MQRDGPRPAVSYTHLWCFAIPLTALMALVLEAPIVVVCLALQGDGEAPQGRKIDDRGHSGITASPEQSRDIGDVKGLHGHHADIDHAHGDGDGLRLALEAVSYTHLDVYKRQVPRRSPPHGGR